MSRITLTSFALLLLLFFGNSSENYAAQSKLNTSDAPTGTFQKMIVQSGSVTMQLDLNRLNGISSAAGKPTTLRFVAAANSFFSFWFSTTSCAAQSRAPSRWSQRPGSTPPATACPWR